MIRHHLGDVEDEEPAEVLRVIRYGGLGWGHSS